MIDIAAEQAFAIQLCRAGRPREAEAVLRRILAMDGTRGEAWLWLGGIALDDHRPRLAARCFARLMLLDPGRAGAMHNLGEALRLCGRRGQAALALSRALRLRPQYPKALTALGMLRQQDSQPRAARRLVMRGVALDPSLACGWHSLGLLLQEINQPEAVLRMMRRAALLSPADARMRTALGLALGEVKEHAAALGHLRCAVALNPDDTALYGSLAAGLMQCGDHEGGLAMTRRVRRMDPMAAEADAQESLLWMMLGDLRRGHAHARRALALAPDRAVTLINAGLLFHSLRRFDSAADWNRRALRLDPRSAVARFNLSLTLLAKGDYSRGWPLYEARWSMGGAVYPRHAPAWNGDALAGRSILLVAEQGHGDTLHFVRYASVLAAMGGRVVLQVQPALKRLLAATPGVAAVCGLDETPPSCDLCVAMLSVPGLVGTRTDTIPASMPYLRPADADRRTWRDRLAGEGRLKVGLVWAGEPRKDDVKANSVDLRRSLTLAAYGALAHVPGVAFYSLQKGEAGAQAKAPPPGMAIIDWTGALNDFADTAALIEQLDLVITVDTSVCHLAGGLGKPVWVLSRFDACWRWLDNREDSPWYPTMRLFHQDEPGVWDAPLSRLAAALEQIANGPQVRKRESAGKTKDPDQIPVQVEPEFALADVAARRTGTAATLPALPAAAADLAPRLLKTALAAHKAGRMEEAAAGYRRVLALAPGNGDGLHLLGLTALSNGRVEAAALLARAVRMQDDRAAFHNSLGELHRTHQRLAMAIACLRRAAALDPGYAEARINLAKLLGAAGGRSAEQAARLAPGLCDSWRALGHTALDRGHNGDAVAAYRRALALNPAEAECLDHMGRACGLLGRARDAEALFARALRLVPDAAQVWRSQGCAHAKQNRHAAAEACLRRAVALQPDFPEALNNLGGALLGQRRFAEARTPYIRAITLSPGSPDPWNNRGNALNEIGETEAAQGHYRRALALNPGHPVAYGNLAEALRSLAYSPEDYGAVERLCRRALTVAPDHLAALNVLSVMRLDLRRLDEAEAGFRRILDSDPNNPSARFNLSLALLKAGRLREAWDHYEARWSIGEIPVPKAPGTLWNGEPLEGRTILLHAEQGHGDVLHFVRYAPLVAQRGGRVRLAVHSGLRRLMARLPGLLSVHNLHAPLPVTDLHCPVLSLPRAFRTGLDDIPAQIPYLTADPADVERWRNRLPADGRLRVGLVWSGDPRPHNPRANAVDRRRSLTLNDLAPLGAIAGAAEGIAFFSLQKGSAAAQAKTPPAGLALTDWMDEVGDFADTAALICGLDLVITVDTSVAHLAGGLGKPVWMLSRYGGCWRWLTDRDDSPWYPTLRLFHQPEPGNWGPAVAAMARELETFCSQPTRSPSTTRG